MAGQGIVKPVPLFCLRRRPAAPPRVYVSSMHRLENHLSTVLAESYGYDADSGALQKLMLFDLQLVFDT